MLIYCTGCGADVDARLTDGREQYPHRPDLADLKFWKCDADGAFVGVHKQSKSGLRPLGFLATQEVKTWRLRIHNTLDPLWKSGLIKRKHAYARISKALGHTFHAGEIYDAEEGAFVYDLVLDMKKELCPATGPWNR